MDFSKIIVRLHLSIMWHPLFFNSLTKNLKFIFNSGAPPVKSTFDILNLSINLRISLIVNLDISSFLLGPAFT